MLQTYDPHPIRIELRQRLQDMLAERGWKRKHLAAATGLEPVTISNLLNNKQALQLYQLDAITSAFELPKGFWYKYYVAECCNEAGRLRPGKIGRFVLRCLKLDKHVVISHLLQILLEDEDVQRIMNILLDIAETIYHSSLRPLALPYYDRVIDLETKRGERLAICYFHRFLIVREQNFRRLGVEALHRLVEYLHLLPEHYQAEDDRGRIVESNLRLEAYQEVLAYYQLRGNWPKLKRYAEELEALGLEKGKDEYLGEALLNKATAEREMGQKEEALTSLTRCAEISPAYARLAEGGTLATLVRNGQIEYVDQYREWCQTDEELFTMLPLGIWAYLHLDMLDQAKLLLTEFDKKAETMCQSETFAWSRDCIRFLQARATYYFRTRELDLAMQDTASLLHFAKRLGDVEVLTKHSEYMLRMLSQVSQTSECIPETISACPSVLQEKGTRYSN
ncbi:helix-turn-helix domain-containing protein [Brevibacillus dissolubilis]|uniref:helix-turn-helix domain-containing protein n=1 Tax=Brevibacillus dissolubilis TaxID=1844116 RepID=UPI00159BC959|nr:helix-turn-helix transcriptional regulator [Brevibacillus dissolubilis]